MNKILIFICLLLYVFPLYSKTIEEFAEENKLTLISKSKGKIDRSDNEQIIALFKINNKNDYRIIYFNVKNNDIVFQKEIEQFHHYFNTSAFDDNIKTNSLIIIYDLDGDSYDELILDYGAEKIYPLVLKYTNESFVQILHLSEYPTSNVILPGAPDIFETWKLVSYKQNEIILKRFQSDLSQYVTFRWDSLGKQFSEENNFNFFENTGFATSNERDFKNIQKEIDNQYLEKLSSKQLRILRNAIYAKYGRKFSSWDLVDNFIQCKWYSVNPYFSEDLLSETDRLNIKKIQIIEQKKGIYKPIEWELKFF